MIAYEKLKERIAGTIKKPYFLPAICGVLLLILVFPFGIKDEKDGAGTPPEEEFSKQSYEEDMEDIISEIKGVRSASVLLSYTGGSKYIYAEDISETVSDERKTLSREVVIASGNPVKVGSLDPEIKGAVIVYTGVQSSSVRLNILNAAESLTGLGSDKITVLYGG